ncbi:hypothetical protein KNE206_31150 [Kitasatospora sp. NE20-6]|uniref:hypothetical protein n=1 Tax=Kitasatospora sp. NE20-6 TaxID=2859066 RepID=UPI0034DB8B08
MKHPGPTSSSAAGTSQERRTTRLRRTSPLGPGTTPPVTWPQGLQLLAAGWLGCATAYAVDAVTGAPHIPVPALPVAFIGHRFLQRHPQHTRPAADATATGTITAFLIADELRSHLDRPMADGP